MPAAHQGRRTIAGEGIGIGGDLPDAPVTAGGKDDRFGVEDMQLTGRQLDGDHTGGHAVLDQQIQHLEFIEEIDMVLDALLVEGLQDHVPGAVGRIAGTRHRFAGDIVGMPAKGTLCDAPIRACARRADPCAPARRPPGRPLRT